MIAWHCSMAVAVGMGAFTVLKVARFNNKPRRYTVKLHALTNRNFIFEEAENTRRFREKKEERKRTLKWSGLLQSLAKPYAELWFRLGPP